MKKRLLGLFLTLTMVLGMLPATAMAADATTYGDTLSTMEDAYSQTLTQGWENVGLKNVDFSAEDETAALKTSLEVLTAETPMASDVMKAIFTIQALGYDPANITLADGITLDGYAVLNGCADTTAGWYFYTAPYVLLALGDRATQEQETAHIDFILDNLANPSSFDSYGFSADSRAMGIIGLASYCDRADVKEQVEVSFGEIEAGLATMDSSRNTFTNAMVVLAYTMMGKDPATPVYQNGTSVVDDLMSAVLEDGSGFVFGTETTYNFGATQQGLVALQGLKDYEINKTTVNPFSFTDESLQSLNESALMGDFEVTFSITDDDKIWFTETVMLKDGDTVKDAFEIAFAEHSDYSYEMDGGTYVESITHPTNGTYGEFTDGKCSGWKYKVNGVAPAATGFSKYVVEKNDNILFYFVADYTKENQGFSDVATTAWYYDAVTYAVDKGLFQVNSTTEFAPDDNMTRGMVWTVLARLAGVDTTPGEGEIWYQAGLNWAVETGISDGTSPDGAVTREQLVTMIYRYAEGVAVETDLSAYTDVNQISGWAQEAMEWAVGAGLVDGNADGTLAPQTNATRAQVATIMMRHLMAVEG